MRAELSQMLARIYQSPGWRIYRRNPDSKSKDEMTQLCIEAYSFDNLPNDIQKILTLCDRTLAVMDRLHPGKAAEFLTPDQCAEITRQAAQEMGVKPQKDNENDD